MLSTNASAASVPSGTDSRQSCATDAAMVGVADGDAAIWLAYAALTTAHGSVVFVEARVAAVGLAETMMPPEEASIITAEAPFR